MVLFKILFQNGEMMNYSEMENRSNGIDTLEGVGSLRTSINFYGESNHGREREENKDNVPLHQFIMEKFMDDKQSDKQGKAQTSVELFQAKKAVKDLVFKIEQSNAQVRARKLEVQSLRSTPHGGEDPHFAEFTQQLDCLNRELGKLKLDVSSALESKVKAEKDIEVYSQKTRSSLNKVEELRKEIEEANEEHVLVELARIEAEKELREIESKRAAEALEFSKNMEAAYKRISDLRREVSRVKELEEKLSATNTDVSVLQNEMELVRAMEKNSHKETLGRDEKKNVDEEQLRNAEDELSKANKELESIKDEGFQFMASMDLVREELLLVSEETNRMKEQEKNHESTIERLNSKLLKANLKLEFATSTEERTREIITNLSTALQKLQSEVETAKEDKDKARKETSAIKQEVKKTEMDIKSKKKELQGTVSELGVVKASEAAALVKLKSTMEKIVTIRAMASQNSTMIRVSNWEYAYLMKKGELAQAVADKKVAAINGWIEALRAQEKEILLKSELIEKEIKEIRIAEDHEQKIYNMEKAGVVQKTMVDEANEFIDMLNAGMSTTNRRRTKARRTSPMERIKNATPSLSFTIKKKKRLMPNLGTILRARSGSEVDIGSYATLLLAPENNHRQC